MKDFFQPLQFNELIVTINGLLSENVSFVLFII